MKIAFFVNSFNIGGIERFVISLANGLCETNNVSIIVCKNYGVLKSSISNKVKIFDLGDIKARNSLKSLVRCIDSNNSDILISSGNYLNYIAIIAKLFIKTHTKLIITQHSLYDQELKILGVFSFIIPFFIRIFYNKADAVVGVSESAKKWLKEIGVNEKKLFCIFNPIDIQDKIQKSLSQEKIHGKYLLYIGRLAPIKNIPLIIKSFKIILSSHGMSELKLLLAGSGQDEEKIKDLCKKEGVDEKCVFLGNIACPEPLIKNAKAVLLASFSETMPFTVLETLTLDTYIVSTPAQGCLDIFKLVGYNYYTQSFSDPQEYADLVCKVMLLKPSTEFSAKIEKTFGVSTIKNQYTSLFSTLIHEKENL
jgi:glycosyltransferase involved in cell wall biosynthesis